MLFGGDCALSIYQAVLSLIGEAPVGFEFLPYVFSGMVLIYLLCSVFSIISSVINFIAGR